jgi:hypothetical protein
LRRTSHHSCGEWFVRGEGRRRGRRRGERPAEAFHKSRDVGAVDDPVAAKIARCQRRVARAQPSFGPLSSMITSEYPSPSVEGCQLSL